MNAIVSEKGQVTIPKEIRDRLALSPGTVLEFTAEKGQLVAWKKEGEDVFKKWRGRGKLPVGKSTDEYLAAIRT
jgi:antitoxin PrlF